MVFNRYMFKSKKKVKIDNNTIPQWLIVGLGNPGKKYEKTRHNAGFMAIDYIAERHGTRLDRAKFSSLVGEAVIAEKRVLLMKTIAK